MSSATCRNKYYIFSLMQAALHHFKYIILRNKEKLASLWFLALSQLIFKKKALCIYYFKIQRKTLPVQ